MNRAALLVLSLLSVNEAQAYISRLGRRHGYSGGWFEALLMAICVIAVLAMFVTIFILKNRSGKR